MESYMREPTKPDGCELFARWWVSARKKGSLRVRVEWKGTERGGDVPVSLEFSDPGGEGWAPDKEEPDVIYTVTNVLVFTSSFGASLLSRVVYAESLLPAGRRR